MSSLSCAIANVFLCHLFSVTSISPTKISEFAVTTTSDPSAGNTDPLSLALYWENYVYFCVLIPLHPDTTYTCNVSDTDQVHLHTTNCSDFMFLFENDDSNGVYIENVSVTDNMGHVYSINTFCLSEQDRAIGRLGDLNTSCSDFNGFYEYDEICMDSDSNVCGRTRRVAVEFPTNLFEDLANNEEGLVYPISTLDVTLCYQHSLKPTTAPTKTPDPAEVTYNTFSIQWKPQFCYKNIAEQCHNDAIPNITIHGIWPNWYAGEWPSYCARPALSPQDIEHVQERLQIIWPTLKSSNTNFGFWSYEWRKHGTCWSIMNATNYFSTAIRWYEDYKEIQNILAAVGIYASNTATYHLLNVTNALSAVLNQRIVIQCNSGKYIVAFYVCRDWFGNAIDCPSNKVSNCGSEVILSLQVLPEPTPIELFGFKTSKHWWSAAGNITINVRLYWDVYIYQCPLTVSVSNTLYLCNPMNATTVTCDDDEATPRFAMLIENNDEFTPLEIDEIYVKDQRNPPYYYEIRAFCIQSNAQHVGRYSNNTECSIADVDIKYDAICVGADVTCSQIALISFREHYLFSSYKEGMVSLGNVSSCLTTTNQSELPTIIPTTVSPTMEPTMSPRTMSTLMVTKNAEDAKKPDQFESELFWVVLVLFFVSILLCVTWVCCNKNTKEEAQFDRIGQQEMIGDDLRIQMIEVQDTNGSVIQHYNTNDGNIEETEAFNTTERTNMTH
eukprot:293642_1